MTNLKPGQECGHRGCSHHISHPCEGCGRYAAGLLHFVKGQEPNVTITLKEKPEFVMRIDRIEETEDGFIVSGYFEEPDDDDS